LSTQKKDDIMTATFWPCLYITEDVAMSGSPRTRPDYRSLFPARTGFSSFLNTLRFPMR